MTDGATLIQAATQFLASLSTEKRAESQGEVHRFVQWCGQDRLMSSVSPLDVANYAESRLGAADVLHRLAPVRALLQFVSQEKLTASNLAPHLRVRKVPAKARRGPAPPAAAAELTAEGRENVLKELDALRAKRPVLADEIKRAAADKDFRENAPLEAAREELGHVEARIREMEALLRGGVVAAAPPAEKAGLGSLVRLKDVQTGEEMEYALVGPREAAPAKGLISANSPVGQAMLGRSPGEEVEVATPAGRFRYRILNVSPR